MSNFFSEIHRNREFYRTHDVRPPFTYASLIRQVGASNRTYIPFAVYLSFINNLTRLSRPNPVKKISSIKLYYARLEHPQFFKEKICVA